MGAKWLIGVSLNLVGSILINLGTNVMKLGHNRRAAMPLAEADKPPVSRLCEWQAGIATFAAGNIANFVSFGYAAQSLLSAIGCVQFVSNVAFASLVLKERVTCAVAVATACIVGGCVLLVSFGDHSSAVLTAADLQRFYAEPAYIAYLCAGAAAVAGSFLLYCLGHKRVVAAAPGTAARRWEAALPVLYSVFSALLGTQSVLLSKTLAVLLRATANGENQFKGWFIYVVFPLFLFTAVFWVTRLNKALRMFPAVVAVPTLQIAWTLFSILSGMAYFGEWRALTPGRAGAFAGGMLVGAPLVRESFELDAPAGRGGGSDERIAAVHLPGGDIKAGCRAARAEAALVEAKAANAGASEETGLLCAGAADSAGATAGGAAVLALALSAPAPGCRPRALARAVSSLTWRALEEFDLDRAVAARLAVGLGGGGMPAATVFGVIDLAGAAAAQAGRCAAAAAPPPRGRPAGGAGTGGEVGWLCSAAEGKVAAAAAAPDVALPLARRASGINPLENAISIRTSASLSMDARPPSPFVRLAHNVGDAARSVRSAVSMELRAAAAQLRQQDRGGRGYMLAGAPSGDFSGEEWRRLIGGSDDGKSDGGGGGSCGSGSNGDGMGGEVTSWQQPAQL